MWAHLWIVPESLGSESGFTLNSHYPISQLMRGINIKTSGTINRLHMCEWNKMIWNYPDEPSRHSVQNIIPRPWPWLDKTYATITLRAPRGVTRDAGAKAYAVKLAASPPAMSINPAHHMGSLRYPYPPSPTIKQNWALHSLLTQHLLK